MKLRHIAGLGCALVLIAASGAPCAAQGTSRIISGPHMPGSMGIPQPEPLVTVSVRQRALGRVLSEIFKQTPYTYRILAELGTAFFTLECQRMPLRTALHTLLSQDRSIEPLVFSFSKRLDNSGEFVIHRELIDIRRVEGENRVSVANGRVTRILPEIFRLMKVKYRIEPDVPPVLLSVQLRPSEWSESLAQVVLEANKVEPYITYSLDGDTYVVHLHKTLPYPPGLSRTQLEALKRVKVSLANVPFKDALAEVFKGSAWKYQVADSVKDFAISYTTAGDTEIAALQNLLRQGSQKGYQVTYREGKGILYIEPGPLPGEAKVSAKGGISVEPTTSLNFTDRLRRVVELLAGATKAKVSVAPNVPNVPVTIKVEDATIEQALQALIESARTVIPSLIFRKMGEEYVIELGTAM